MFLVSCCRPTHAVRRKVWRPVASHLRAALGSPVAGAFWQVGRVTCPADAAPRWEGGSPSWRLSPGDVPLSGSETRHRRPVRSTQVWTPVWQLRITDLCKGTRRDVGTKRSSCRLFGPASACSNDAEPVCALHVVPQPASVEAALCQSVDIPLFIRNWKIFVQSSLLSYSLSLECTKRCWYLKHFAVILRMREDEPCDCADPRAWIRAVSAQSYAGLQFIP